MTAGLGARIREARQARGLSLRATAAIASISPSLLSQVETGKVQPSVSTLWAIVSGLGLSVDDVLHDAPTRTAPSVPEREGPVQRREDAPEIRMENGVSWRGLAVTATAPGVDAVHVTYQPGGASSLDDSHMRHEGVEYGYLIRGELTLKLDFDSYVLRAGDSFSFDSMRPHLYLNASDGVAEGIWFVTGATHRPSEPDESAVLRDAVAVLGAMSRLPGRA
ncbi:cupin domain-containing protein [Microbacterium sp. RD1]|uniref:cupin domain-containing protein n=1 Tax=Microbacterium sp. RD1 TaxID=3457313 RepID=UPI003FA5ADF2